MEGGELVMAFTIIGCLIALLCCLVIIAITIILTTAAVTTARALKRMRDVEREFEHVEEVQV